MGNKAFFEMEQISSVEVILDDLDDNPKCPHGPTLLFRRFCKGEEQKFYACSACRDRRECPFYLRFDDKWSSSKESTWRARTRDMLPQIDHSKLSERLQEIRNLLPKDRAFCHTCNTLLLPPEWQSHDCHEMHVSISDYQLSHPSEIMKPLENSKKEAQYLFSIKSVNAIVNMLQSAGIRHVLCIGSPRIHEYICSMNSGDMTSILLDFDHRYHQFFEDSKFVWFNAFNCHWFAGERGKATTVQFMKKGHAEALAIVTDPPFGGRVEPLLFSFRRLDEMHEKIHPQRSSSLSLMWIFPYFMESAFMANHVNVSMLDYKVEYDNHPLFHQGIKGRKYGSPVRIFTNMNPSKLPLPKEDGYWFCEICIRWSSIENRHCHKCGSCTSKNGCTYVHCDICNRCVKPSWKHCGTCERCCMQDHKCGKSRLPVCFGCHQPDHKKNECPLRNYSQDELTANRKRIKKKGRKSLKAEITPIKSILRQEIRQTKHIQKSRYNQKRKMSTAEELCIEPCDKRKKL